MFMVVDSIACNDSYTDMNVKVTILKLDYTGSAKCLYRHFAPSMDSQAPKWIIES
jgi:hypothetical protein